MVLITKEEDYTINVFFLNSLISPNIFELVMKLLLIHLYNNTFHVNNSLSYYLYETYESLIFDSPLLFLVIFLDGLFKTFFQALKIFRY